MLGIALPKAEISLAESPERDGKRVLRLVGRYGLSAVGPLAVSGAHFVASLVFLHRLSQAEFGLFSFLLIVVPFCLSLSSGLLGAPLVNAIGKPDAVAEDQIAAFRSVNLLFCLGAGLATALLMLISNTGLVLAVVLGGYGATMSMRWFARYSAYIANHPGPAAVSDLVYSSLLLAGLALLAAGRHLSMLNIATLLLISSVLSVLAFGRQYLHQQFAPKCLGAISLYGPIWRDVTRWSLMGVMLSEMTANAHAYLVTFLSGPKAFGLLAVGSLLMRPVFLVLSALPDRERSTMARFIAAGNINAAWRSVREFRAAASTVWFATVAIAAAILTWSPGLIVKHGNDFGAVLSVVAIWTVIVAVRAVRTPEAVFLQAAGEFNALARAGMAGSIVSLFGTLVLLLWFGPVASLFGILGGETVMTFSVVALRRSWRRSHA
jgi:hypothetical protein